jgi:[ribosomal protein S5]-alanine N-acetyltransferase
MDSFSGTPHYFIAVVAKDADLGHIGNVNVYVDENNKVADIGILLGDKKVWGHGYGTEAWKAVCEYLLLDLNLRKVTAGTSANNAGMRGIMRSVGMIEDGKRARQLMMDGQEIDIVYTALFRETLFKT